MTWASELVSSRSCRIACQPAPLLRVHALPLAPAPLRARALRAPAHWHTGEGPSRGPVRAAAEDAVCRVAVRKLERQALAADLRLGVWGSGGVGSSGGKAHGEARSAVPPFSTYRNEAPTVFSACRRPGAARCAELRGPLRGRAVPVTRRVRIGRGLGGGWTWAARAFLCRQLCCASKSRCCLLILVTSSLHHGSTSQTLERQSTLTQTSYELAFALPWGAQ